MSVKRVLAAQGRGEEVEKRIPEEESPEEEKAGEGGDSEEEGEDVKEVEGKIFGCRVFSSLSKQEVRRDLSTKVTLCTFVMIFSICAEEVLQALDLCRADSLRFIGEISGDDSAAEEDDVEGEEDKEEDGGVSGKVEGGGICKRDLRATRSATEAWREGGSLASL